MAVANGLCVQFGCGLTAPSGWINFDASPSLRLQRVPILARLVAPYTPVFPSNALYGDIVRGLPIQDRSCRAVFASHVLEHLALADFQRALKETLRILAPGGRFRLIVPDLKQICNAYVEAVDRADAQASHRFMRSAHLGMEVRAKGLRAVAAAALGNSQHLWMWDRLSMREALAEAGFTHIRDARQGDSDEKDFELVEDEDRFVEAIAFEAIP